METVRLKKRLRQLKKAEERIRFKNANDAIKREYLYDSYFTTKAHAPAQVKYSLEALLAMEEAMLSDAIAEFYYAVYFQYYKENGIDISDQYDPQLLADLGLPANASQAQIKARFRQLAMRLHPDHGGDADAFVRMMETYKKL